MPRWRADPQAFWAEAAERDRLDRARRGGFSTKRRASTVAGFRTRPATPVSTRSTDTSWRGAATSAAILYDSPVTATKRRISYAELLDEVATLAAVLCDFGVGKGDRVIVYMPMIPEAVVAMLACARIGAVHSVVFGGFAAKELATRIDDAEPKLVLTASCGIEPGRIVDYKPLLDGAIELCRAQACRPVSCCSGRNARRR